MKGFLKMRLGIFFVVCSIFIFLGCSAAVKHTKKVIIHYKCSPDDYIVPDLAELTSGHIYEDKYINSLTGAGVCVKITGKVKHLAPGAIGEDNYVILYLSGEGASHTISCFAKPELNKELRMLKKDQAITVYGRVWKLEQELAVLLQDYEVIP